MVAPPAQWFYPGLAGAVAELMAMGTCVMWSPEGKLFRLYRIDEGADRLETLGAFAIPVRFSNVPGDAVEAAGPEADATHFVQLLDGGEV